MGINRNEKRGRDPGVASTTGGGAKKPNWEPDWAEAQRIATACPDAAAFSDYAKKHALSYAVELGAPFACVRALYDACPDAITQPDKEGRICMHFLSAVTPLEVVQLVLQSYPQGVLVGDKNERIPIMFAIKVGVSSRHKKASEVAKAMERVYAEQARKAGRNSEEVTDKYGKTLLHFVTDKTPLKVVQMLVQRYPNTLRAQDNYNKFPVQAAMLAEATEPVIEEMKRGFPTAKNAVDLWEACNTGDWDTVVQLADDDPNAVRIACEETKEWAHFALQLVLRWNYKTCDIVPGRVVQKLVDTYPAAADMPGKNPFGGPQEGDTIKPIDIAKKKLAVHKQKCIGCQDVIHALTNLDAKPAADDPPENPEKLTGVDPYHVEKNISDKDLRGTLLLFCKSEELDQMELTIHDETDRRLAAEVNVELPPNRAGAATLDDLADHAQSLQQQGVASKHMQKERSGPDDDFQFSTNDQQFRFSIGYFESRLSEIMKNFEKLGKALLTYRTTNDSGMS